jgi:glycosyltransferase involved in cell wall biosynthesis
VASRNEAPLLERCLPTIRFCDEILVIDLESKDATAEVAVAHGARVIRHANVAIAERARMGLVDQARHDWLLFTDPDEELPGQLASRIAELFPTLSEDVALVYAPIQYYFGSRPLQGTIWGGANQRRLLVRRDRVELHPSLFAGTSVLPGYCALELPFTAETAIVHHWVTGYGDFVAKHRRYLAIAGEDRRRNGEVTGLRRILTTPWRSFRECYFEKQGYRDGLTGLALSLCWAWYSTSSEIALRRSLRRR